MIIRQKYQFGWVFNFFNVYTLHFNYKANVTVLGLLD